MEKTFEVVGYSISYYVSNKYVGSLSVEQPDREVLGYYGRREDILTEDLTIGKKKLKKGTLVKTELHKICGRLK